MQISKKIGNQYCHNNSYYWPCMIQITLNFTLSGSQELDRYIALLSYNKYILLSVIIVCVISFTVVQISIRRLLHMKPLFAIFYHFLILSMFLQEHCLSITNIIASSPSCIQQYSIDEDNANAQPSYICTSMIIHISCRHPH